MIYKHYSDFDGEWRWKNFSPKELSCKCCGEYYHDEESLDRLQKAREYSPHIFKINSAHRCVAHNKSVGGSMHSQHLKIAFDISIAPFRNKGDLLQYLFMAGFTTFGLYGSFIHTDKREWRIWYGCDKALWGDLYDRMVREAQY